VSALRGLGRNLATIVLAKGDNLFHQGDAADRIYVVVTGRLEVVLERADGVQHIARVAKGAVIGEIGLIAGGTRSATVRAVTACELVSIEAEAFLRLLADYPEVAESLATAATSRLRQTQLVEHFNQLFGVIDPEVLASIERLMEWESLAAGQRLFSEGDEGDAAFLVATGRLGVFQRDASTGAEVEIGELGRGDIVGELSLFDGEPRGATVYALRDTQLIRFSRAVFAQLFERYPHIGLAVTAMAMRRQRPSGSVRPERCHSFVLVPITAGLDVGAFAERLAPALDGDTRILSSAALDVELNRPCASQVAEDGIGSRRLAYALEELEEQHRSLVYLVDDEWTPWSRRALRSADHIVLVADATGDPLASAHETEMWALLAEQRHARVSLVLVHPADTLLPEGTRRWLELRAVSSHFHVRDTNDADTERLARLLAGRATSLVLGGGGARGFAHLGVLKVLGDLGVPVDMIAGSSIGSIMAIGPGFGWRNDHIISTAVAAFRKLMDYTIPSTSILRGARITANLRSTIGDVDIADLWIPYFCVSTNITKATIEYHDRGDLVHAIRASIAIPGVLPPVPRGGDLLVDGGILDNVPVDEMRRRNPSGVIIAVDVAEVAGPVAKEDFGLSTSGLRSMRARRRGGGPPTLLTTMVRSSLVGSIGTRQRIVREGVADLYLEVGVDGGGLLDFSAGASIVDAAVESTRQPIRDWVDRHYRRRDEERLAPQVVRTAPTGA